MSASSTTTAYPASNPVIRPALVSQSPKPRTTSVSCHHSASTASPPAPIAASARPGPMRTGPTAGAGDRPTRVGNVAVTGTSPPA